MFKFRSRIRERIFHHQSSADHSCVAWLIVSLAMPEEDVVNVILLMAGIFAATIIGCLCANLGLFNVLRLLTRNWHASKQESNNRRIFFHKEKS